MLPPSGTGGTHLCKLTQSVPVHISNEVSQSQRDGTESCNHLCAPSTSTKSSTKPYRESSHLGLFQVCHCIIGSSAVNSDWRAGRTCCSKRFARIDGTACGNF